MKNKMLTLGLIAAVAGLLFMLAIQSEVTSNTGANEEKELQTDVADTVLFDWIEAGGIHSISIIENGEIDFAFTREYESGEPLFYSDLDARIRFHLDIPPDLQLTPMAMQNFFRNIHLVWESDGIKHDKQANIEGISQQNFNHFDIILRDQPLTDLDIRFQTDDRQKSKSFKLNYVEPFTYDIQAWDPKASEINFKLEDRYEHYFDQYVLLGKPYELKISFSADVDRASVEQKLADSLIRNEEWEVEWVNDRTLKLTIRFTRRDVTTVFNMNGVRSKTGYELKTNKMLAIRADHPQQLQQVDLNSGEKTTLFSNITHYAGFEISPDGEWFLGYRNTILATLSQYPQYTELFNKQGNILAEFEAGEIFLPHWLPDEDAFVYYSDGKLMKYEVHLAESTTLWQFDLEDQSRMNPGALAVDPDTGRIAVSVPVHYEDGFYEADLYLFDHAHDQKPRILERYISNSCSRGCTFYLAFAGSDDLVYHSVDSVKEKSSPVAKIHALKWEELIDHQVADYRTFDYIYPLQGELLLRKRHDGKWHRYHLESKSMVPLTLNIGSLYRVPNPIISLGSEQYLFRIHNEGWYRMNLIEGTVEPESDSGLHENTMWVGNASAGHEYVYILSSE